MNAKSKDRKTSSHRAHAAPKVRSHPRWASVRHPRRAASEEAPHMRITWFDKPETV